jgi:hypothetical protein
MLINYFTRHIDSTNSETIEASKQEILNHLGAEIARENFDICNMIEEDMMADLVLEEGETMPENGEIIQQEPGAMLDFVESKLNSYIASLRRNNSITQSSLSAETNRSSQTSVSRHVTVPEQNQPLTPAERAKRIHQEIENQLRQLILQVYQMDNNPNNLEVNNIVQSNICKIYEDYIAKGNIPRGIDEQDLQIAVCEFYKEKLSKARPVSQQIQEYSDKISLVRLAFTRGFYIEDLLSKNTLKNYINSVLEYTSKNDEAERLRVYARIFQCEYALRFESNDEALKKVWIAMDRYPNKKQYTASIYLLLLRVLLQIENTDLIRDYDTKIAEYLDKLNNVKIWRSHNGGGNQVNQNDGAKRRRATTKPLFFNHPANQPLREFFGIEQAEDRQLGDQVVARDNRNQEDTNILYDHSKIVPTAVTARMESNFNLYRQRVAGVVPAAEPENHVRVQRPHVPVNAAPVAPVRADVAPAAEPENHVRVQQPQVPVNTAPVVPVRLPNAAQYLVRQDGSSINTPSWPISEDASVNANNANHSSSQEEGELLTEEGEVVDIEDNILPPIRFSESNQFNQQELISSLLNNPNTVNSFIKTVKEKYASKTRRSEFLQFCIAKLLERPSEDVFRAIECLIKDESIFYIRKGINEITIALWRDKNKNTVFHAILDANIYNKKAVLLQQLIAQAEKTFEIYHYLPFIMQRILFFKNHNKQTILTAAMTFGRSDIVSTLRMGDRSKTENLSPELRDKYYIQTYRILLEHFQELLLCCGLGHLDIIKEILEALRLCCHKDREKYYAFLMHIPLTHNNDSSLLLAACESGNIELVTLILDELLVSCNGDKNKFSQGILYQKNTGFNAVAIACYKGCIDILKELLNRLLWSCDGDLDKYYQILTQRRNDNFTLLHTCAVQSRHHYSSDDLTYELLNEIYPALEKSCNNDLEKLERALCQTTEEGFSFIMTLAKQGYTKSLDFLLEKLKIKFANNTQFLSNIINQQSRFGCAINTAEHFKNKECFLLLANAGANVLERNSRGETAINNALQHWPDDPQVQALKAASSGNNKRKEHPTLAKGSRQPPRPTPSSNNGSSSSSRMWVPISKQSGPRNPANHSRQNERGGHLARSSSESAISQDPGQSSRYWTHSRR